MSRIICSQNVKFIESETVQVNAQKSTPIIQQFEVPMTTLPKTSNSDTQYDQDQEIDHSTDSNWFDTSDDTSDNNSEILVDHMNDPDDYCCNITDKLNFDPNESIYYMPK
ncbi:hypothetical protein EV182_006304, partial [Spiromyces aspiralis]